MHVLANTVCTTAGNLLPKWNSTPHHQWAKKHYKKSHGARKYACNLCANKKLCFNERSYKSGRHNRMRRKVSTLWPTSVYRKARKMIRKKKEKTKPPPAVRQPLPTPEEPDLCNYFITKEPDYIDCFCINFPQHCVLGHVLSDSNPLGHMNSWKKIEQPFRKSRSIGPRKSKQTKSTSKKR